MAIILTWILLWHDDKSTFFVECRCHQTELAVFKEWSQWNRLYWPQINWYLANSTKNATQKHKNTDTHMQQRQQQKSHFLFPNFYDNYNNKCWKCNQRTHSHFTMHRKWQIRQLSNKQLISFDQNLPFRRSNRISTKTRSFSIVLKVYENQSIDRTSTTLLFIFIFILSSVRTDSKLIFE